MAASNGSPLRQQAHVPAWKRLGLKLKYAKEDAVPRQHEDSHLDGRLRTPIGYTSEHQVLNEDAPPPKKRRTSAHRLSESQHSAANELDAGLSTDRGLAQSAKSFDTAASYAKLELLDKTIDQKTHAVNDTRPEDSADQSLSSVKEDESQSRRKSVTFTTDTKQEDGISASPFIETVDAGKETTADQLKAEPFLPVPQNTRKQKKRAARTSNQAEPSATNSKASGAHQTGAGEYKAYLQLFYTDKSLWKFNKNKQTELLKNLFNIDRLPAEHDQAVLEYISGLQGAAARRRVIEEATAVLKEIAEKSDNYEAGHDMDSEEARINAYKAALHRHIERSVAVQEDPNEYDDQQIEQMRRDAERGRRAEAILGALLQKELHPEEVAAQLAPSFRQNTGVKVDKTSHGSNTNEQATSKRKRRKARTQTSSDTSSSDSSDGDEQPKAKRTTVSSAHGIANSRWNTQPGPPAKQPLTAKPTGTRKIFDDELLDQVFPKKKPYRETAAKGKPSARTDESGSESESSDEDDSSSE